MASGQLPIQAKAGQQGVLSELTAAAQRVAIAPLQATGIVPKAELPTFTYVDGKGAKVCPVTLTDNITKDELLAWPAFKNWIAAVLAALDLQKNPNHKFHAKPFELRSIKLESVTWFKPGQLGFIKLAANISPFIPGTVFLRGGSVAILMILQPDDAAKNSEDEKQVLLAVQPRIAAGSLAFAEIPAGIIDKDEKFVGTAAREIKEETGIKVRSDELFDMSTLATRCARSDFWKKIGAQTEVTDTSKEQEQLKDALYPSVGGCDEFMSLYLWQKRMPRKEIKDLEDKITGEPKEGEIITLKLVPLEDLWFEGARDGKTMACLALYEALRKRGMLPPSH